MKRWDRLNERQLEVLKRVSANDPPVTAADWELARTVYALRDRGLVLTPRFEGRWRATITDAGRFYLREGRHPDEPGEQKARVTKPARAAKVAKRTGEEVVALLSEYGMARIDVQDQADAQAWRAAVHDANKRQLVEPDHHLQVSEREAFLVLDLVRGARSAIRSQHDRNAVAVPETLRGVHPQVAAIRDRLKLSDREVTRRALLVLAGLAAEAVKRGFEVQDGGSDGLSIGRAPHLHTVEVREQMDREPHVLTAAERRDAERYSWTRTPKYDYTPSGRLGLHLQSTYSGNRHTWVDGKKWRIEQKLDDVLIELDRRVAVDEERERVQQEEKVAKLRRWEAAMSQAQYDYRQHVLVSALRTQATAWQEATLLRSYCEAFRQRLAEPELSDTAEAEDWLSWASAYADSLDPLWDLPTAPEVREPSPNELQPFLHGWSPYGPERDHRWRG